MVNELEQNRAIPKTKKNNFYVGFFYIFNAKANK